MPRHTLIALSLAALFAGCAGAPPKEDPKPAAAEPAKPADTTTVVPEAERWRATPPEGTAAPKLEIPKVQQEQLKNGVLVMVSEQHELPLVDVRVALRAGSSLDPAKKYGLADLTYELMLEGAGKKDGVALAEAFADLGTTASVATDDDGAAFQATVLSRNIDPALGLLAEVLQKPRLAKEDFERKQKESIANLTRQLGNPFFLLLEAAGPTIYGADHPYGHVGSGTIASVEAITLADAKKFYRQQVGPKVAAVIFSGDITMEQARALTLKHFGKWRGRAKPPKAPPVVEATPRTKVVVVPKPGLGQTFIAVGRPAVAAGHADEWALSIANAVYGGMFSSRLNMNLREDKGYTYGARAMLMKHRGAGALVAFTPVQADKTGASIKEIFAEMSGLKTKPITSDEFSMARDGDLRAIPGWFETISSMGGTMAHIFYRELPLDRINQLVKAYQAMDQAGAQATALKYFDPAVMQVILVGDPEVIKAQVAELKLGEIELRAPPTPTPAAAPSAEQADAGKVDAKKAAKAAAKQAAKDLAKQRARAAAKAKAKAKK